MKRIILVLVAVVFLCGCAGQNSLKYHQKLQKENSWTPQNWKVDKSLTGNKGVKTKKKKD